MTDDVERLIFLIKFAKRLNAVTVSEKSKVCVCVRVCACVDAKVLDANREAREMFQVYTDRQAEILCGSTAS